MLAACELDTKLASHIEIQLKILTTYVYISDRQKEDGKTRLQQESLDVKVMLPKLILCC